MLPKGHGELSQKQQALLGLPVGMKMYSCFPFGGMNQQDSRMGMDDNEFFLRENYIRIGKGNLRTVWDQGTAIFTASGSKTIVYFFFFNIGSTNYVAIFLSDGTAVQVDTATLATTTISATTNTFYTGGQLPACAQWGSLYLVIVNNITSNGYWLWDGSVLYTAGTLSPVIELTSGGSGYSSVPTVTAFGGSGSGATFLATISGGSVVSVKVLTPGTGYQPSDIVQLIFSGGGTDNGAKLSAVLSTGTVQFITLLTGGSNYVTPVVAITGGAGSGATATATQTDSVITSVLVTAPGSGYTSTPTVSITDSGFGDFVSGSVITAPGSGYSAPLVGFSGGGGSGATATATQLAGALHTITITNGGSGYTSAPTITITDGGGGLGTGATADAVLISGSGATAVAALSPGSVASVAVVAGGSGFISTPLLTISGGGGSGATAVATLTTGAISSVSVTTPGSGYTSTPTVTVQSGINNAASGSIFVMPFGVSGSSVETFSQRLWIPFPNQKGNQQNGGTFLVSAPGSLVDFATSDGGLTYVSSSPFLRAQYTNIKQSNGYLYPIGDSSVDVISNVQTSGSPTVTTFNYQNTDPQSGTSWRDSVTAYSRTILMANQFGVFGLYGGSVAKISGKLDDLFTNAIYPPTAGAITPCAATADIFSQKVFMLLVTIKDPMTEQNRTVLVGWDEKDWMLLTQTSTLTFINTQEVNTNLTAWGTDGKTLFPLFNTPSAILQKKFSTKLWGADSQILVKQADMLVLQARDNSANSAGIAFSTFTVDNELQSFAMPTAVSLVSPAPQNAVYSAKAAEVPGCNLGLTCVSTSPDFTLNYLGLGYRDISSVYGSQPLVGQEEE